MKGILICLFLLFPVSVQANNFDFKTNAYVSSEGLLIKSVYKLRPKKIKKVKRLYVDIRNEFMQWLPKHQRNNCEEEAPIIVIVNFDIMSNPDIFYGAKPNQFGRYMFWDRTIYIVRDMFSRPEWLAHELAHHFYQDCNINFASLEAEHKEVYDFQEYYRRKVSK